MKYKLPYTIDSGHGERLTFLSLEENAPGGPKLLVENLVQPGKGPMMHVHFKQNEGLTVIKGTLATQLAGEDPKIHQAGESATFLAGEPHAFWNAGTEPLVCKGWIQPADNIIYFLDKIYESMRKNNGRPDAFTAAWLLDRYKNEYDMPGLPGFVKKVIFPITKTFGNWTGKHRKFSDAPAPV
jgi:quercetin dioxygenase-like cupin family protein